MPTESALLQIVQSGPGPRATADPCVAHRNHLPDPLYCELHHVIPQAWQAFWRPVSPPTIGPRPEQDEPPIVREATVKLWDKRTVALCRTGHGNVHTFLVRAMRAYDSAPGGDPVLAGWVRAAIEKAVREGVLAERQEHRIVVTRAEAEIAKLAMIRWAEAGGSLKALCQRKLWGGM